MDHTVLPASDTMTEQLQKTVGTEGISFTSFSCLLQYLIMVKIKSTN